MEKPNLSLVPEIEKLYNIGLQTANISYLDKYNNVLTRQIISVGKTFLPFTEEGFFIRASIENMMEESYKKGFLVLNDMLIPTSRILLIEVDEIQTLFVDKHNNIV